MNRKEYQELVDSKKPKEKRTLNMIRAFFVGGFIGLISEFISYILVMNFNVDKMQSYGIVCLIIVFVTCLLTALSIFDNLVSYAKCGLIIPTTGFAHSICSCALDYKREGYITGVGSNIFKLAGSVILYGIFFSFLFCLIKVIFL